MAQKVTVERVETVKGNITFDNRKSYENFYDSITKYLNPISKNAAMLFEIIQDKEYKAGKYIGLKKEKLQALLELKNIDAVNILVSELVKNEFLSATEFQELFILKKKKSVKKLTGNTVKINLVINLT